MKAIVIILICITVVGILLGFDYGVNFRSLELMTTGWPQFNFVTTMNKINNLLNIDINIGNEIANQFLTGLYRIFIVPIKGIAFVGITIFDLMSYIAECMMVIMAGS